MKTMKSRKKIKALLLSGILFGFLVATVLCATVTLGKFSETFAPKQQAQVASARLKIRFSELKRTDTNGVSTQIPPDVSGNKVVVEDLEPQDTVECRFAVADVKENEVKLKVTLTIIAKVTFYRINEQGRLEADPDKTFRFEAWKNYDNDGNGYLQFKYNAGSASVNITKDTENDLTYPEDRDYCRLYVSDSEGDILNRTGFTLRADETENVNFIVVLRLPDQTLEALNYATAAVSLDIRMNAEQMPI